jgi:hypothetical protein
MRELELIEQKKITQEEINSLTPNEYNNVEHCEELILGGHMTVQDAKPLWIDELYRIQDDYMQLILDGHMTFQDTKSLTGKEHDNIKICKEFILGEYMKVQDAKRLTDDEHVNIKVCKELILGEYMTVQDAISLTKDLTRDECDNICDNIEVCKELILGGHMTVEDVKPLTIDQRRAISMFRKLIFDNSMTAASFYCKTPEQNYMDIIAENEGNIDKYHKITAFFLLYFQHFKALHAAAESKKITAESKEINNLFEKLEPQELRYQLQKILNRMGGYNLMPKDFDPLTIGVEIEYSNVPEEYRKLLQDGMHYIQTGWGHPGDQTVLAFGNNAYPGESTTPIISNNEDFRTAMLNIAYLQAMGAETNITCGLHVHVGVRNIDVPRECRSVTEEEYQLEFLKQFIIIYKREEAKFREIERSLNTSSAIPILELTEENIKKINNAANLSDLIDLINPKGSRDYEINLHAMEKHGTIEIRKFQGTTEEATIFQTVQMIESMAQEAKSRTNLNIRKRISSERYFATDSKEEEKFSSMPDIMFAKQKTERHRELLTMRVKTQLEDVLEFSTDINKLEFSELNPLTIYVGLNPERNAILYKKKNQKGELIEGIIQGNEFNDSINKLISNESLSDQEKNNILIEIAQRGHANISHRVEKIAPILEEAIKPIWDRKPKL